MTIAFTNMFGTETKSQAKPAQQLSDEIEFLLGGAITDVTADATKTGNTDSSAELLISKAKNLMPTMKGRVIGAIIITVILYTLFHVTGTYRSQEAAVAEHSEAFMEKLGRSEAGVASPSRRIAKTEENSQLYEVFRDLLGVTGIWQLGVLLQIAFSK